MSSPHSAFPTSSSSSSTPPLRWHSSLRVSTCVPPSSTSLGTSTMAPFPMPHRLWSNGRLSVRSLTSTISGSSVSHSLSSRRSALDHLSLQVETPPTSLPSISSSSSIQPSPTGDSRPCTPSARRPAPVLSTSSSISHPETDPAPSLHSAAPPPRPSLSRVPTGSTRTESKTIHSFDIHPPIPRCPP